MLGLLGSIQPLPESGRFSSASDDMFILARNKDSQTIIEVMLHLFNKVNIHYIASPLH